MFITNLYLASVSLMSTLSESEVRENSKYIFLTFIKTKSTKSGTLSLQHLSSQMTTSKPFPNLRGHDH